MKKSTFITIVFATMSILFFAIGMCMALIPEWNAFRQGVVFGCIGIILALITFIAYRRMTGKAPVEISLRMIGIILVGIIGTLLFGVGMCFSMVWGRMVPGIVTGIIGIAVLLSLIPLVKGFED